MTLALLLLACTLSALAQTPADPAIHFTFQPSTTALKAFEITLPPDGHGTLHFTADPTLPSHELQVSPATLALLRKASGEVTAGHCETHLKHIANTGRKTLAFGDAACTFNYSDEADLNAAANTLLALEHTVEMGDELARLHRFDRLGLDAAMESLQKALESGSAIEVANIAPILQSLVNDDRVIDRVRRRAARLLESVPHPAG